MSGGKREKREWFASPLAAGCLLVFLGLPGTFLPVITAFSLPVRLPLLLIIGALLSVYVTTMFAVSGTAGRRIGVFMLLLLAAAWIFVCVQWRDMLRVGAQVAVSGVVNDIALGVDFVSEIALPTGMTASEQLAGCTLFFAMLAAPVLLLYGWSIVYFSAAAPCMVVSLPFFAVTMILMDEPPALYAVLCTLLFWMLLLLPQSVRRASPRRGAALTFLYLPVLAVLCGAVLLLSPRETYVRAAWPDVLREQLISLRSSLSEEDAEAPSLMETVQQITASRPDTDVNVRTLGPRRTTGTPVLEVKASASGELYLRGAALGVYDGASWRQADGAPKEISIADVTAAAVLAAPDSEERTVEIRHLSGATQLAYVPYYAVAGDAETGEVYARPVDRDTEAYTWVYRPADNPAALQSGAAQEPAYRAWAQTAYTGVPEPLAGTLRGLAASAGIDGAMPRAEIVSRVAAYIRQAGYYDLEAERAPNGADFIQYFLTESHRGYCVHFASAATAMLQSLGVPARYVSGYLVDAEAGEWTRVTDEDAHAWTEIYLDGFGWMPVEVTGSTPVPTPAPTAEPTAEPSAEPTTEPEEQAPDNLEPEATTEPDGTEPPQATAEPAHGETAGQQTPDVLPPDSAGTGGEPEPGSASDSPPARNHTGGAIWLLVLLLPAAAGLLVLRRRALRSRRAALLRQGSCKKRILAAWRELQRLCRYGTEVPQTLTDIALEARFSDHGMTEAQLEQMRAFLSHERKRLSESLPPLKRLAARYLHAVL